MIKMLGRSFGLVRMFFGVQIPRRDPTLPTEANYIRPFTVNNLQNNQGSRRYPKEVGRGPGTGKGKFSARGMKGHKCRTGGGVPVRFEGGQTPITRRIPKYGRVFRKKGRQILDTVNLGQIDYFIKKGILNPNEFITIKHLNDCGLVKKVKYGVKVLGKGFERINYPIKIQVSDCSKPVIKLIEQNGGEVRLVFRTQLKLKEHIYPERFPLPLADPLPPAWRARKLERLQKSKGHQIVYRKPLWQIQHQKLEKQEENNKKFVYPISRETDPNKIHKRKVKLYRKISYNI